MLILRRRAGESFFLGHDSEIQILEISGNQVKLGISAPRHVSVIRSEVLAVSQQNRAAAVAPAAVLENFFRSSPLDTEVFPKSADE